MSPILIAGGGVGGLASALALARRGHASIVMERRDATDESGAGIQIGPNGVHTLRALGVADLLQPVAGVPEAVIVNDALSGREIVRLPLGDWIAKRHGAPYWVLHRSDLHGALRQAAVATGLVTVMAGTEIDGVKVDDSGIEVDAGRAGSSERRWVAGAALIGADGIWSTVRRRLAERGGRNLHLPRRSQTSASRAIIARPSAGPLGDNAVHVWMSPSAHVVHYPVRAGADVSLVAFARDPPGPGRLCFDRESGSILVGRLGASAPVLVAAIEAVPEWRKWPVVSWQRPDYAASGRVTLLGDAAHPIRPYLAQGAVMALEDAVAIAAALAANPGDPATAFAAYAQIRRARVSRVATSSYANGLVYHLPRTVAAARNTAMRLFGGKRIMAGYDWLYGWKG